MNLKQMRYFLAVAEELHFGRAADRLHVAQPPLSRQIRAMEEELGTPLFVRNNKGTELTEAGRQLLQEVPNILALTRRAEEHARLAGAGYVGRLDVGIFTSGILEAIPRLLAQFRAARPAVKIGMYNMNKKEQIAALLERRITVGFNRLVPEEEEEIAVETVMREPFIVALYESHPLCAKSTITLPDLDNEPMILYPNVPVYGLAQDIAAAFRAARLRLRVEQEVEDVITCLSLVAHRFGVAITTASAANLALPGIVYRPLDEPSLKTIELGCLYRHDDTSPILHAFLASVRTYAASRER